MSLPRYFQIAALGAALLGLAACSGGSSSTPIAGVPGNTFGNPNALCDPGGGVQLANPPNGNVSVPTNVGSVIIVTDSNSNTLSQNPGLWNVVLVDSNNANNVIQGGNLTAVPFTNGPHPYANDFYFASSMPQLPSGRTWNVYLNENANCNPGPLGNFST